METYDSDGGSSSEVEEHGSKQISNFDDLPTDDSESDSSEEEDESELESGDSSSNEGDQADIPLSERVASRALKGRRYYTTNEDDHDGKQQRCQRKSKAIQLASQRLKIAKGKSSLEVKKSSDRSKTNSDDSSVEEQAKRKKSKHAPTVMSSKRRDFYSRKADLNSSGIGISIGANKYKPRDPRMISLSGHLDNDLFEKRYGFLDEVS